jgi:hypothetical protein
MALRDEILAADDLPLTKVDVDAPGWPKAVWVRVMTGTERDAYEESQVSRNGKDVRLNLANFRAKLLCMTLVDEKGERIFGDEDAAALGKKSSAVLDKLYTVASRANGLSAKDVEELTKNSDSATSDVSISGSLADLDAA